jgi:hypothetical protein
MDANKLTKLREIGFEIRDVCATCEHGNFGGCSPHYGTCRKHVYVHSKHTGPPRRLSVRYDGHCDDYRRHVALTLDWSEFGDV